MIETLFASMEIPEACLLDKPVYKKMFLDNAELDQTDKKALSQDADRIRWRYTLKPETINIRPFQDGTHDYPEVAILSIELSSSNRARRIAAFMHRAIPYPLILVFEHEGKLSIAVAEKRINQADKSKMVILDRWQTDWFDPKRANAPISAFLDAIALHRLPGTNFYALYEAFQAQVIQLIASERTGTFAPVPIEESKVHAEALKEIDGLEREIAELKSNLKREKQMSRKVDLNSKIRSRKNAILALEARLRLND
ncbi:DUF4391 domain-containing protein [Erythrobacter sp. HKB08]|uniref:DUF4391 domain-containing protein n=1 Tax=Erythrobacter sp. HKB08 TaxID=2502843 RepID=UPI00100881CA|nr:DUF4391 domain-containing protein [Erythrobacter sp. HKB08]